MNECSITPNGILLNSIVMSVFLKKEGICLIQIDFIEWPHTADDADWVGLRYRNYWAVIPCPGGDDETETISPNAKDRGKEEADKLSQYTIHYSFLERDGVSLYTQFQQIGWIIAKSLGHYRVKTKLSPYRTKHIVIYVYVHIYFVQRTV